ncbi:MAG: thioesterase II family protein [Lachnospiraceae bacterium]
MAFFDLSVAKESRLSILCFPYAGGGAGAYWKWTGRFPGQFGFYPVHLPGREQQICEPLYHDICKLAEDITEEMVECFTGPLVLFGHSMGGKIAYEVAKRLEKSYGKNDISLIVSGSRAPCIPERKPICHLGDETFISAIKSFGGTPAEITDNKELINFFLPILRADFTMDETYLDMEWYELSGGIRVYIGQEDEEVTAGDIDGWRKYTAKTCEVRMFAGGHFFIYESEQEVISEIIRCAEGLV